MIISYSIDIHPGSDFQKQFIEASMNALLESVKQEFESKHQDNQFIWQERIFVD